MCQNGIFYERADENALMLRGRLSVFLAYRAQIKYPVYLNPISICLDFMNLAMDLDLRNTKSKFFV